MATVKISALPAAVVSDLTSATEFAGVIASGPTTSKISLAIVRSAVLAGGSGFTSGDTLNMGATPATSGVVRLSNNTGVFFRNAANSGNVELIASTAADKVRIAGYALFPSSDGTANYVLQTDGSGNLSWVAQSGGGGGITGSGTTGKLAKWTGSSAVGDSIVSESGTVATVTGTLVITGSVFTIRSIAWTFPVSDAAGVIHSNGSGTLSLSQVVNADVSSSAAIAYSKLALTGAILNADLAGSIAYGKLSLTGAILNADLAGSIALTKLSGWPANASGYLNNDGAGTLTWATPGGGGTVTGTGTTGKLPKWSSSSALTDSVISESSGVITITGTGIITGSNLAIGTSPAASGALRLANTGAIIARNAANSADKEIAQITAADKLKLYGTWLFPTADAAGVLKSDGSGNLSLATVVNADVSSSAAIAYSKLALTGAILNADLAGSIAYSKLSLTGAILNADLAGSIADSKLSTISTAGKVNASALTGGTIILSAAGGWPSTTSGATGPTKAESATNKLNQQTLDFATATKSYVEWTIVMPPSYGGGTITAQFLWLATGTSTNSVVWGCQARAFGNNVTFDQAFGTAQEVTSAHGSTASQVIITSASSAITIAGSPAAGQLVQIRVYRLGSGSDTLAATANLLAVQLNY